ncbi:putative entry exclusion protein TrbK-alt [Novosphingobium mathurense]|uniref:putative entry exclusion protein TrbK-alt n=1 Tax=Novosphingobium mathurense TaxID=428990 RepID=UPI00318304C4
MRQPKQKGASVSVGFAGNDMSRTGKLAVLAALGGLVTAIAILGARSPTTAPHKTAAPDLPISQPPKQAPARCRTITRPDAACSAAWEERRNRFFGSEETRGQQP